MSNFLLMFMQLDYQTLKGTIKVFSDLKNETLQDKLLKILNHNEIQKPEKHNKKDDISTSNFTIDLDEDEINKIIDVLEETQIKFIDDGEINEQMFYHYSDLIDNWIDLL